MPVQSCFYSTTGRYPKLCCRYKESNGAGDDIFRKFSAYIKNPNPGLNDSKDINTNMYLQYLVFQTAWERLRPSDCVSVLENKFLSTLVKLNMYLETPLPYELDKNPNVTESSRLYLDGDTLSLADCNLLPKLNIVKVRRVQSERTLRTGLKSSEEKLIKFNFPIYLLNFLKYYSQERSHFLFFPCSTDVFLQTIFHFLRWCVRSTVTLPSRHSWKVWHVTWKMPTKKMSFATPAQMTQRSSLPTSQWLNTWANSQNKEHIITKNRRVKLPKEKKEKSAYILFVSIWCDSEWWKLFAFL